MLSCGLSEILLQASGTPGSGSDHVVRLLDHFKHVGPHGSHVCMVFEPMGANLLSLIKHYDYHGVPIDVVRHIARQVLLNASMTFSPAADAHFAGTGWFGLSAHTVQHNSHGPET